MDSHDDDPAETINQGAFNSIPNILLRFCRRIVLVQKLRIDCSPNNEVYYENEKSIQCPLLQYFSQFLLAENEKILR